MYQFIESKLKPHFNSETLSIIKKLVDSSVTFTLSGMPGVGGSIFLRYLSLQKFAHFIYIDTYQLAEINRLNYYQQLLKELGGKETYGSEQEILEECRNRLGELAKSEHRIVIIFNRFDQLRSYFSDQLFADLMSLKNVNIEKIVFIFTSHIPYIEILPENISADKINNLFSKTVFLKPYSKPDLHQLLNISSSNIHTKEFTEKAIDLCGGHFQLLQLFLKSERLEPPFIDQFVKIQLKEIFEYLNYNQKKIVKKIALGKPISSVDEHLLGVGVVKKTGKTYELFTPLFTEFIKSNSSAKMSLKESKLYKLLKENIGKVVSKEQIFSTIWDKDPDNTSDWALSSLLYRLRKHPTITSQNIIIESYKKLGIMMLKD